MKTTTGKTLSQTSESDCCAAASPNRKIGINRKLLLSSIIVPPVSAALYFGWPWLTAVGAAPLLITFAPCAAMCALGLCMKGGMIKTPNSISSSNESERAS